MAKLKVDLSGVKNFIVAKGERAALAIALVIGLGLVAIGMMGGRSAPTGESWHAALTNVTRGLQTNMASAVPGEKENPPKEFGWPERFSSFAWGPVFHPETSSENKRRSPLVLALKNEFQMDYIPAGVRTYDIDKTNEKITVLVPPGDNQEGQLAVTVRPRRMLVVSAVFPYKQQLKEFQEALRLVTLKDVSDMPENAPRFLGLIVGRQEVKPGVADSPWVPLYKHDATLYRNDPLLDKTISPLYRTGLHASVDLLFREAILDVDNQQTLPFTMPGLTTPVPELANAVYPKIQLTGLKSPDSDPNNQNKQPGTTVKPPRAGKTFQILQQPMGNPEAGPNVKFQEVSWKAAKPEELKNIREKLSGVLFPFEPNGMFPERMDPAKGGYVQPLPGPGKRFNQGEGQPFQVPVPGQPTLAGTEDQIPDLLVRFIDPDVQPGRTYRYSIRVRLANPNYKRVDDVAHKKLAEVEELEPSAAVFTPEKTIPTEFFYYAVDQNPLRSFLSPRDKLDANRVAVQLHRWIGELSKQQPVAGWAVAERLLVRRGEYIGKGTATVELPVWNIAKEQFELGSALSSKFKRPLPGVPVNFTPTYPPPLLVDFGGGVKYNEKVGKALVNDESAVDMLVLTPEGKLTVRNSRVDTDPEFDVGKERNDRYQNWLKAIEAVRPKGNTGANTPPTSGS